MKENLDGDNFSTMLLKTVSSPSMKEIELPLVYVLYILNG